MEDKSKKQRLAEEKRILVEENEKLRSELVLINQRLLDAEKFKSNFLSNIRNTIINPFTSVLGLSDHIINTDKYAWKTVISLAALIHSEAFKLNFQFNNIFMAAELESGEVRPKYKKVDLHQLIQELLLRYRHLMRKKSVRYEFNCEISDQALADDFVSDPMLLELIMVNLIDNAIKFSPQASKLYVTLIHRGNDVRVKVKNMGSTIKEEYMPHVFDRFRREDESINSIQSGHGLGLSVSKQLVELLGGTMDVSVSDEQDPSVEFTIGLTMTDDLQYVDAEFLDDSFLPHEGELF
jgi:two-component system, OmpR family, phosphate regulon sensor histidine kinase PhoR